MICPSCGFEYTYEDGDLIVCSACQFSWPKKTDERPYILDSNGNKLYDGDSVIVIKDLKVRGSSQVLKQGTKVDSIRIIDGRDNHNIACRIKGFGRMELKGEIVRKA